MKTYFPDTNFFFECRKATDLTWHTLGSAPSAEPDILLIIPPTVIREIERHKTKGNSRTAKRAREASAKLREAMLATDQQVVLREIDPKVILRLPPVFKVDFSKYPDLDHERPDHRIAAECATMNLPDAALLTDDTLAALAARSISLPAVLIPSNWKLAPENDERDDTIAKLQLELKGLKHALPEMTLKILDEIGEAVIEFRREIIRFTPSAAEIDHAVEIVKDRHPITTNFIQQHSRTDLFAMGRVWMPPTQDEIDDYTARKYPEWVGAVRKRLEHLGTTYDEMAHEIPFSVSITNNGFVNAANVRLFVDGFDGIGLLAHLDDEDLAKRQSQMQLPKPIPAPRGTYRSMHSFLDAQVLRTDLFSPLFRPSDLVPERRHPNKFYFSSRRPSKVASDHIELGCEAFPHQSDAVTLSFRANVGEQLGAAPRIRIRLEAANLRQPIEVFVRFDLSEVTGDFLMKLSTSGVI